MAEEKIIAAKLQLDTSEAGPKVKEFNEELNKTSTALQNTNKTAGESSSHFANLKNGFASLPGPLGEAAKGAEGLGSSFKALLANPVVLVIAAIVGALTLLYKAFTSTEEGGEKVEQIMSGIGAVVDVIRDRVLQLAGAVVKFFKGDFKGAAEDAKASINGFKDDAVKAYNAVAEATQHLQEAEDELNRNLLVNRAKLNRDLATSKELITDETAGYSERRKAIDEVRKAEGEQSAQELANAQKTLDAIHEKMAATKNVSADLTDEEAKAQARLYEIQQQSAADQRNLNRQSHTIEVQEETKAKEAHQKYLDQKKQADTNYNTFVSELTKARQENEIAGISDAYAKQIRQAEINYDNQKAAYVKNLKDRQLTTDQYNRLIVELDKKLFNDRSVLFAQHNSDLLKQLNDFEAAHVKAIEAQQQAAQTEAKNRFTQGAADREAALGTGSLADREAALNSEVALFKNALDAKLISEKEYTDKTNELAQKRIEIGELERQQKMQAAQSVGNALNALGDLIGKQTAVGKGLAIATALINTWQGASEALKQKSVLPSPFDVIAKVANVATIVATGLNTVRQITKVSVPGGGGSSAGGGASVPGVITPTAPISPQQNSTTIDQSSINGIGDATKNRSYILESDITRDQNKTERLNRAARLGG